MTTFKTLQGAFALPTALALLTLCFAPDLAHAGGFSFPENGSKAVGRGGAYGLGRVGPEALHFNPAMLSGLRGFQLTFNTNLIRQDISFQRAAEGDVTFDEVTNDKDALPVAGAFPAPMLFMSYDFNIPDFTLAAGVYGPSAAGTKVYDENGAQRYVLVESRLLSIYYSLAASYHWKGLRLGGTFQMAQYVLDITTTASSALTTNMANDENPDFDAYTNLKVDALHPTGILGLAYDINPSWTIGATYRFPVKVEARGKGTLNYDEGSFADTAQLAFVDEEAVFRTNDADYLRFGARYAHLDGGEEIFDVELTSTYEFWSRQDEFRITLPTDAEGCSITSILPQCVMSDPLVVPKNWKNSFSVRLGGDYNLNHNISLRAGAFYETETVPTSTTHMDFFPYERAGGGLGATFLVGDFELDLGYLYLQAFERTVTDGELFVIAPQAPGGKGTKAVNNGVYNVSSQTLSLGLTWRFDDGPRNRRTPGSASF